MAKIKKIKGLIIAGKRWFDRKNGNTYHSCTVYINGQIIGSDDFSYGYGESYIQTGFEILQKTGYWAKTGEMLPSGAQKDYCDFIAYVRTAKPKPVLLCTDVSKKSDL